MYTCEIVKSLEEITKSLIEWYKDNKMKLNPDKCHLVLKDTNIKTINVDSIAIKSNKSEKLLGVAFDHKSNFQRHIENLCSMASKKLHGLARISLIFVCENFFLQFNYYPLVWMCNSRTPTNKINKLHERCVRLIYSVKTSTFQELLDKDSSLSVHMRNIRTLKIKYKLPNDIFFLTFAN